MHSFNNDDCQLSVYQHCRFLYNNKKKTIEQKEGSEIKPYVNGRKRRIWLKIIYFVQMFSGNDVVAKMCYLVHYSDLVVFHSIAAHKDCRSSYWQKKSSSGRLLEYPT